MRKLIIILVLLFVAGVLIAPRMLQRVGVTGAAAVDTVSQAMENEYTVNEKFEKFKNSPAADNVTVEVTG